MLYVFENGKMSTCGVVCKISTAYQLGDFLVRDMFPLKWMLTTIQNATSLLWKRLATLRLTTVLQCNTTHQ